jgi:curved DNA-binding protein CbpA
VTTHYDTLEVSRTASPQVIRAAYRSLMQTYHPDKHQDHPEALARAQHMSLAYQVLSDEKQRAAYDAQLASVAAPPASDEGPSTRFADTDDLNSEILQAFAMQEEARKAQQRRWRKVRRLSALGGVCTGLLLTGIWSLHKMQQDNLPNQRLSEGWAQARAAQKASQAATAVTPSAPVTASPQTPAPQLTYFESSPPKASPPEAEALTGN